MSSSPATAGPVLGGRYEVGDLIGRGGMGEVRSGWDNVLERPIALKLLRADAAANPDVRRRFEAEAKAVARLVHPNIVQVFDSGEDGGTPFMVMERLPGGSLRDELRTRTLSAEEATSLALQVLAALDVAHRAGVVHRDIKPANILCAEPGHWKVADFGIAKSVQPTGSDETMTGMVLGTPAYLPPERLLGGDATPAGDVYALGVILYEALAGRRPFEAADPAGWVAAAGSTPVPLQQLRPDLPPSLTGAVGRSLSADASKRFADAGEMATAIRQGRTVPIDDRTGWLAVPPAMPVSEGDTDVLPAAFAGTAAAGSRRAWMAMIGTAIAVLIALAIGLSVSAGSSPTRSPAPPATPVAQTTTTVAPTTTLPPIQNPDRGHGNGGGNDNGDHGG